MSTCDQNKSDSRSFLMNKDLAKNYVKNELDRLTPGYRRQLFDRKAQEPVFLEMPFTVALVINALADDTAILHLAGKLNKPAGAITVASQVTANDQVIESQTSFESGLSWQSHGVVSVTFFFVIDDR